TDDPLVVTPYINSGLWIGTVQGVIDLLRDFSDSAGRNLCTFPDDQCLIARMIIDSNFTLAKVDTYNLMFTSLFPGRYTKPEHHSQWPLLLLKWNQTAETFMRNDKPAMEMLSWFDQTPVAIHWNGDRSTHITTQQIHMAMTH